MESVSCNFLSVGSLEIRRKECILNKEGRTVFFFRFIDIVLRGKCITGTYVYASYTCLAPAEVRRPGTVVIDWCEPPDGC